MQGGVDIVIVNWNAGSQLGNCLRSIESATTEGRVIENVIIVDNASTDESLAGISNLSLPLKIIRNKTNLGFAAACNQGASLGTADFILFLNPDSELFSESLSTPISFLENAGSEQIGIVGIQLVDESGIISRNCARFPSSRDFCARALGLDKLWPGFFPSFLMTSWDHTSSRMVDHVIGAFYLVRRTLFHELSGFDEKYFVYLEDLDFSLRAKKAGWVSYYIAETRAFHRGGGTSEQIKGTRVYYSLYSRIIYSFKHHALSSAVIYMIISMLVEPFVRLFYGFRGNFAATTINTLIAYSKLIRNINILLSDIRKIVDDNKS